MLLKMKSNFVPFLYLESFFIFKYSYFSKRFFLETFQDVKDYWKIDNSKMILRHKAISFYDAF